MKKIIIMLMIAMLLSAMVAPVLVSAHRVPDLIGDDLLDPEELEGRLEGAVTQIIDFVRFVALIVAVLMTILLAVTLIGGGDERGMAKVKTKAFYLVIALFILFQAERIVGFIIGIFQI